MFARFLCYKVINIFLFLFSVFKGEALSIAHPIVGEGQELSSISWRVGEYINNSEFFYKEYISVFGIYLFIK